MLCRSIPLFVFIWLTSACSSMQSTAVGAADVAPAEAQASGGMAAPMAEPAPASDVDDESMRRESTKDILSSGVTTPAAFGKFEADKDAKAPAKKQPQAAPPAPPGGPSPNPKPKPVDAGKSEGGEGKGNDGQGTGAKGTEDRKSPILIYTADFTMSVYEVAKSLDAVEALAKKSGGYLSRRDDRAITVRVPAGEFQGVINDLSKLGDVVSRNVVSEDVTAEYRDLEVQLANSLALRDRFAKLLDKAQKVEEALQIERELGRITGEIERIKGRLKLLSELAAYSTITVNFAPRSDQTINQGPFVLPLPWLNNLGLPRLLRL